MSKVTLDVIPPANRLHATVKRALDSTRSRAPLDYNILAEKYNKAEPGSVVLFMPEGSGYTLGNLKRVVVGRGLTVGATGDVLVEWLKRDKYGSSIPVRERPMALTKLTAAHMRII